MTARVSIHAPHAGRDYADVTALHPRKVSIHAPHAGRDLPYPVRLSPL